MRIRITRLLTGSIDGIQLAQFRAGHTYDVHTSLATYLLCEQLADLVMEVAFEAVPLHLQGVDRRHEPKAFVVRSVAAERTRPRTRPKADSGSSLS